MIACIFMSMSLLLGCVTSAQNSQDQTDLRYLAKTDIDTITDIHVQRLEALLRPLAEKLYRRNPKQCPGGTPAIDACVAHLFDQPHATFPELNGRRGVESIRLCFAEDYPGDRVLALVVGLHSMLIKSYGNKREFFFTDELDPQKLYNAARNIEITVWRLSNQRTRQGKLFLLSNGEIDGIKNLSFERLFGKMISLQDTMSAIIAEKSHRRVKNIVQRLATALFLPI